MSETKLVRSKAQIFTTAAICVASLLFIGLLLKGLSFDTSKVPPSSVDKLAKPFRVAWIQGQEHFGKPAGRTFRLEDFRGKKTIVNFWASWCVSCRTEAHELESFFRKYGKNINVVGIAIQDEPSAARDFTKRYGKSYIIGLDEDGKAGIDYGVSGVPETFIIDAEGYVREKITGPVDVNMLEKALGLDNPES
jgi:cytochrome c biogenesis protein CcmG, thiol:disulfide interchange protein DsbE